jgi:hypothetical protein
MKRPNKIKEPSVWSFADRFSGTIELPDNITLKYKNGLCIEFKLPRNKEKLSWIPNRDI